MSCLKAIAWNVQYLAVTTQLSSESLMGKYFVISVFITKRINSGSTSQLQPFSQMSVTPSGTIYSPYMWFFFCAFEHNLGRTSSSQGAVSRPTTYRGLVHGWPLHLTSITGTGRREKRVFLLFWKSNYHRYRTPEMPHTRKTSSVKQ